MYWMKVSTPPVEKSKFSSLNEWKNGIPRGINLIESTLMNSEMRTLEQEAVAKNTIQFLNEWKNRIPKPGKIYKSKMRVSYNDILKIN